MSEETVGSSAPPAVNPGTGQGATMDNLSENIAASLGETETPTVTPPDVETPSAAPVVPLPATTPAATPGSEAGQPAGQPGQDTAPEDKGTIARLQQDMAVKDNLLRMLNIDPNGNVAEKIEAGLLTQQDLVDIAYKPVTPTTEPASPKVSPEQTLSNLQTRISQRGDDAPVSAEMYKQDVQDLMKVVVDLADTNKSLIDKSNSNDLTNLQTQNLSAVDAVFNASEILTGLPDTEKAIAKEALISMTDYSVVGMSQDPQVGQKAYTPQGYNFAAKQALPKVLALLKGASIKGGQQAVLNIANNPSQVTTMQPSPQGSPVVTPPVPMTLENLGKNTDAFIKQYQDEKAGLNQV